MLHKASCQRPETYLEEFLLVYVLVSIHIQHLESDVKACVRLCSTDMVMRAAPPQIKVFSKHNHGGSTHLLGLSAGTGTLCRTPALQERKELAPGVLNHQQTHRASPGGAEQMLPYPGRAAPPNQAASLFGSLA